LLACQGDAHRRPVYWPDMTLPAVLPLTIADVARALSPRLQDSHKGMYGRVLVVGGGFGMPGAVALAARAALRVGAGSVTVASHAAHMAIQVGARPEVMFRDIDDPGALAKFIREFDVIAVGPGLGRDAWAQEVLNTVLKARNTSQQLVLDADALNLVAAGAGQQRDPNWILTPHPGEAARLLGEKSSDVQADRPAALQRLLTRRGGTVVLKGAATLVGKDGEAPRGSDRGNPGMAVAGMGDVLTGAIAGLCGQLPGEPFHAACAAVFLHASAGDRCAARGVRGIFASEVADALRDELAQFA
jgi:ADP-dependent NAD(P)H-hydrate dehydratase / NAD(P)H-hydrate epimerase